MASEDFIRVLEGVFGLRILGHQPVRGGDIARSYLLQTARGPLFVKILEGPRAYDMLTAEAEGLTALKESGAIAVPEVYQCAKTGFGAALLMEYISSGRVSDASQETLGRSLALLHQSGSDTFGWSRNNYIGTLPQNNPREEDWATFFARHRLSFQFDLALSSNLLEARQVPGLDYMIQKIESLVPEVHPALLHGDLWGGNYLISKDNTPYLIDPSVYYGHSDVDLAMSRLFGGFSSRFYDAYFEVSPAHPGFEDRIPLYQLYYLLVHLNIFGRSYLASVTDSMGAVFGRH
ncbi:fructosamine kinase family protein [Robiginitalea sp.]|uniref:fructosamine kinase family protein n=1 Tax=Robiginitalea sp. TaxID=1902411 RepID=UPI003C3804CB